MRKNFYSTIFALFCLLGLNAQTIITQWDFNTLTPGDIATATPSTGTGTVALIGGVTTPTSGSAGLGSSDPAATNVAFQTTTYPEQGMANQMAGVRFNASTVGFQSIKFKFDLRLSNTSSRWILIQYTLNGNTWLNFNTPIRVGGMGDDSAGDQWFNGLQADFSGISGANNNANFGVRVVSSFSPNAFILYNTSTSYTANTAYEPARNPSIGQNSLYGPAGTMRYDMVTFEGAPFVATPTINATPMALSNFVQVLGSPSAAQSFVASASALTGNLTITAPANYQVSLSSGSGFQNSLILTPSSGNVANTTIFVRLNAGSVGNHSGNVVLSSAGASNVNVALSGLTSAVPVPVIVASPTSLSGFNQVLGTPSAEQVLTVSGQNLTANIQVIAPTGYEVSLSSGSAFGSSVTLNQVGGSVTPTSVYVRLNHNVAGSLLANLILSSTGATDVTIPLSGSVSAPASPFLAVTPNALNPFLQNIGFPSATQIVTVGGENLTGNVNVSVNSNFFISTAASGPFSQSLVLTPVSGYLEPTQVFVHLNANIAGTSNGLLTVSTPGAASVEIPLTGESVVPSGSLIYYWHFNTLVTPQDVTVIEADYSLIPMVLGSFQYTNPFEGQRDMDAFDTGSDLNVQMGEGSGKACRVRNPSTNRTLDFFVPTNNAYGIRFAYAVHRSGQGMLENIISYSLNGTDFITTDLPNNVANITETYALQTFDFSDINGANNNPNFRIRIAFNGNTVSASGNNRFDNITLMADTYSGLENMSLPQVLIFPNPAEDALQVISEKEILSVTMMDLNGRVVLESAANNLNVAALQSGMYIALIETTHGTVQRTFVKK